MIKLRSNAKINLGLNIVDKLENGYHILDMIMVPISLSDFLSIKFKKIKGSLKITTNKVNIPTDERNILSKVYKLFFEKIGKDPIEIEVYLEKNIPHQAGLGGGSSNGATFLLFLNRLYNNYFSKEELLEMGKEIGADVPFFILNKPARVGGIGEKLEIIENNLKAKLVVIKPRFGVSTKVAYSNFNSLEELKKADIDGIIEGLKNNECEKVRDKIENQLEQSLLKVDERIISFRKYLNKNKKIKFFMSGSGSAYYGLILPEDRISISILKERFKNCEIFTCNFVR